MSNTQLTTMDELATLRSTNLELLSKSKERKQQLVDAEIRISELSTKLATAESKVAELTIGIPLRNVASTVSPVATIWISEFQRNFRLEADADGKLQVLTLNGDPVTDGKEPLVFDAPSIIKLIANSKDESLSNLQHITNATLATGGGATSQRGTIYLQHEHKKAESKQEVKPNFGLR